MRDAYLIAKNELLVTVRNPYWLFHGIVQPIIYLVLFAPLLNGVSAVPGFPARNAIQFFAPGLLIMNVLFSAGFEGFTLQDKVDSGFLERLRVTPITRLSLALGFILQSSATLIFQSLVLIAASLLFGLKLDVAGAIILLALIVLIGVMMASISFTLALMTREGGILAGITNTFILPLLILSGVMLPIGFGPPIIQAISHLDPFFYAVNAARALVNGSLTSLTIPEAFGVFAVLSALTLAMFINSMREAVA